jgi:hypothetical protein
MVIFSQFSWAQVDIHLDSDPGINYNGQTVSITQNTPSYYVYMHLVNTSNAPIDILFRRVILNSTATFYDQFCDDNLCFPCSGTDWTAPSSIMVSSNDSTLMKPQGSFIAEGSAQIRYYIINNTSSTILDSVDLNITYSTSTGININQTSDIIEYPNPVKNVFNIDISSGLRNEVIFSLYRITGEKVIGNQLLQGNNRIILDRLSSGMYFYTISSNEEIIKTKKLVIK